MKTKKNSPKLNPNEFLSPAPANFQWQRCPEADQFIETILRVFLSQHRFAKRLADRMLVETSTWFSVWVDHILIPNVAVKVQNLLDLGFREDKKAKKPAGCAVYFHPYADLPKILISSGIKKIGCAIAVENIWEFQLAHGLSLPIEGTSYSAYRRTKIFEGDSLLLIIERRGAQNFLPDIQNRVDKYIKNFELWTTRPRRFESAMAGMKQTLRLARQVTKEMGTGAAAHIFLEAERLYWQSRNTAAQIQKTRQDRLGLGWANHDHHTFRSSRSTFPTLMEILLVFGFKKRERYYAGAEAGWGAQILEQPEAGTIIFADVDLAPEDISVDFSKVALPDLPKPRTVGLWCALHGDSILESGMHHLEAKFDFDQLKSDLGKKQIDIMPPFSDFPFLRQAFTKAEMWRVPEARLNELLQSGKLSEEAFHQILEKGAVGSHMENLQRKDGFKGFNQRGVSQIISTVNPEKQALAKPNDNGAA